MRRTAVSLLTGSQIVYSTTVVICRACGDQAGWMVVFRREDRRTESYHR